MSHPAAAGGSALTAYTHFLPPPDGSALQHPHALSQYSRMFGQELVLPSPAGYYSSAEVSSSVVARLRGTNESGRAPWAPSHSRLPTEQQQQMYQRMQQQQHDMFVAQAFAAGRGRQAQPQQSPVPGPFSQRAEDPNGLAGPSHGYLPPHIHPVSSDRSSTAASQDASGSSQSVPVSASAPAIQRTSSANLGHRVHLLSCAHCALPLTDRGMKVSGPVLPFFVDFFSSFDADFASASAASQAVLLLKPHISLYSTDACPVNVGPLFIPDGGGEAPRDGPERTCDCLTQGLGCLGCGSLLGMCLIFSDEACQNARPDLRRSVHAGYYIAIACSRCTNSVSKNQRSANGHRVRGPAYLSTILISLTWVYVLLCPVCVPPERGRLNGTLVHACRARCALIPVPRCQRRPLPFGLALSGQFGRSNRGSRIGRAQEDSVWLLGSGSDRACHAPVECPERCPSR